MKAQREALRDMYIQQGKMADPTAKYKLGQAPQFRAECMDMCPEFERHEREFQTGGLDKFEKLNGTDFVDHSKAVKRYRRSAAGDPPPLPCDVRPPKILQKTFDYLMKDILDVHGLLESYSFVRDRARAIRNDLTLQNYRGPEAIDLHERIARYHILCSHRLCNTEGVSLQQEHEQLRKTLQSLMEFYKEKSEAGLPSSPNESEFQAYYILTHAYSNDTVSRAESLHPSLFYSPIVQKALKIQSMMARTNEEYIQGRPAESGSLNNYVQVIQTLKDPSTSYLIACCVHMNWIDIQRGALKAMQKVYYCFPDDERTVWGLDELADELAFEDGEHLEKTLAYYEIPFDSRLGLAYIGKLASTQGESRRTVMEKGMFKEGQRKSLEPLPSKKWIESKVIGVRDMDIIQGNVKGSASVVSQESLRTPKEEGLSTARVSARRRQTASPLPESSGFVLSQPSSLKVSTPSFSFAQQQKLPVQDQEPPKVPSLPSFTPSPLQNQSLLQSSSKSTLLHSVKKSEKVEEKEIPQDLVQDYVYSMIDEEIPHILSQDPLFRESLASQHKLIATLTKENFEKLLEQVIQEELTQVLETAKKLKSFRDALQDTFTELMNETSAKELKRLFQDYKEKQNGIERFGWDRWRFVVHLKKIERDRRVRGTVGVFLNLQGLMRGALGFGGTPLKKNVMSSEELRTSYSQLPKKSLKAETFKRTNMNLAALLYKSSPFLENCKLCISIPQHPSSSSLPSKKRTKTISLSFYRWLSGLLSTQLRSDENALKEHGAIGIFRKTKGSKIYSVVTQEVDAAWIHTGVKLNCETVCSGVNAALFVLDATQTKNNGDFWEQERKRLYSFLSQFPSGARVPLLLVQWSESNQLIRSFFCLEEISKLGGPISSSMVMSVPNLSDFFDSKSVVEQLSSHLSWLMKNVQPLPVLIRNLRDTVMEKKVFEEFDGAMSTIQASLQENGFLDLPLLQQALVFNDCARIFNSIIKVISDLLSSDALQHVPYPASEFVSLGKTDELQVDWNSPKTLRRVQKDLERFTLPDIPRKLVQESSSLQELHTEYLSQSMKITDLAIRNQIQCVLDSSQLSSLYLYKVLRIYSGIQGQGLLQYLEDSRAATVEDWIEPKWKEMKMAIASQVEKVLAFIKIEVKLQGKSGTSPFRSSSLRKHLRRRAPVEPSSDEARKRMKRAVESARKSLRSLNTSP